MGQTSGKNYQKQSLSWVVVYVAVGAIIIGLIYYFLFYAGRGINKPSVLTRQAVSEKISPDRLSPAQIGATQIVVENFQFSPLSVTIKKGDSVVWMNRDGVAHTVTSDTGGELSSSTLNTGGFYAHSFNTVGTFKYHCNFHRYMQGAVVVTDK